VDPIYHAPADAPYPGDHTFEFDSLLRDKLQYHRNELRNPALLAAIGPFLNAANDSAAFRDAVQFIRPLIRDAWNGGRFVFYRVDDRYNRNDTRQMVFLLDGWGNGWYFRKDERFHDTYRFQTAVYSSRGTAPTAADSLTRAAVVARRRFVGFDRREADDGLWSEFRFGWADFWRPDWKPPLPSVTNPLAPR
jgi:hypothetical protein